MRHFLLRGIMLPAFVAVGHINAEIQSPGGYSTAQTEVPESAWSGGFDYLPDGRLIVSDNQDVFIIERDGTHTVVASFEMPGLFGSFVKVAPDGHTVYIGESTLASGTISEFDLNQGGTRTIGPGTESVVAAIELNYDMEFDPSGRAFVSAATPETWQPNRLLLLDPDSGETELIAIVQGNSGPLDLDEAGNLFYCTSTSYPPAAVESVIFFPRDKVDEAIAEGHLAESDALEYISGIFAFSDMVFDGDGDLFGVTSSGVIVEISAGAENVVERRFASVSPDALGATVVRFLPGTRAFQPYYQDGGTLTFLESDFGSFFRLVHVSPSPEFRAISVKPSSEGMNIGFPTEAGKQYWVYWRDGMGDGRGWQSLGEVIPGHGEPLTVSDVGDEQAGRPSPNSPSVKGRFYRIETAQ